MSLQPYAPTSPYPWSSETISRMFGLSAADKLIPAAAHRNIQINRDFMEKSAFLRSHVVHQFLVVLFRRGQHGPSRISVIAASRGMPQHSVQRVFVRFVDVVQRHGQRDFSPMSLAWVLDLR